MDYINSVYGDVRYMVYIWGFPYLDYPLVVSISWIQNLSLYNWFCLHLFNVLLDVLFHARIYLCSRHSFWYIFSLLEIVVFHVLTWFLVLYWFHGFSSYFWSLTIPVYVNHIIWSCTCVTAWVRQLALSYILVGLFSDNPRPSCSDPEAWTKVALL